MNRSLEALAIFTICLGGILAVVRFSAQDRTVGRVAEQAVPETAPAKNCGSAVEKTPDACELAYAAGCGLDRNEGTVYAPYSPLLSPREVALLAIRSAPIPLVVLPEAQAELQTGYDAAYDAAMGAAQPTPEELARAAIEAEYAAAELAAAGASAAEIFTEFSPPSPTWILISRGVTGMQWQGTEASAWLQRSYVEPFARALLHRCADYDMPRLLSYPRAQTEARQPLLYRQRAENMQRVDWNDYLEFADGQRTLTKEHSEAKIARQKPRNVLWPR